MAIAPRLAAVAAVAATLGLAAPAEAVTYGGWSARFSADSWHDDNLSRGLVVSPATLPYGNQDLGLHLGAMVGNVWLVTADVDTWLIVDLHGSRGLFYPALGDAWGSLFSNTVWHLGGGRETYMLLGSTAFWGNGAYHAGEVGFVQPLWSGANARVEAGAGAYVSDVAGASFGMPSVGAGLDQAFPTGTQLALRYAFQPQLYGNGDVFPRHQAYLRVGQRLWGAWECHANYLETIDTRASGGYLEGYFGAGIAYDL